MQRRSNTSTKMTTIKKKLTDIVLYIASYNNIFSLSHTYSNKAISLTLGSHSK